MSRIHFVVEESARIRYQAEAEREGKSLGQWLREAADEKLEAARPRRFTADELEAFNAACDARHPRGAREPDWEEVKRLITEDKLSSARKLGLL
jgi:hypothetical protein